MGVSNEKILNATKWSAVTELFAKLLVPITNIILARLLSPDAYGIVATVTMVINFAEIFSDAGFQKYLIQHEFKDKEEQEQHTHIAFWTNMVVALALWIVISLFKDPIASFVGSSGYGQVISIAGLSLPLLAFSSIQMAILRRELEYKKLFRIRLVSIITPFLVTIPLAFAGFGYWALIVGTICGNAGNVIALLIMTKWRPRFYYKFRILKEMLSFSLWTIVEAFTVWLTNWADIFIVGQCLTSYHLGIYKTAPSTIGGIVGIITGTTTNILFASLSRLQNDPEEYNRMFLTFQQLVSMLVVPIGFGILVYRQLVTDILLGPQWNEAVLLIGLWGVTSAFIVIYSNYSSELYRSKGKPMYSALVQISHVVVLIPVCYIAVRNSFTTLVYARAFVRIELIIVQLFMLKALFKFPIWHLIRQNVPVILSSVIMAGFGCVVRQLAHGAVWELFTIGLCVVVYAGCLMIFPTTRYVLVGIINNFRQAMVRQREDGQK